MRKKKSIKLEPGSKFINKQLQKNQIPKKDELVDNVAAQILIDFTGEFWFTNLDLKYAYIQLLLDNYTSNQWSFIIIKNNIVGTYHFFSGYYELDDMPNEFQRVMDSTIGTIPIKNCYLGDLLVASKGSFRELKAIVLKIFSISDLLRGQKVNFTKQESIGLDSKSPNHESLPWWIKQKSSKDFASPIISKTFHRIPGNSIKTLAK